MWAAVDPYLRIVVDNGLIAAIIAVLGWAISRSIEGLKSGLSWEAELLKQRMECCKRLQSKVLEVQAAHLNIVGNSILQGVNPMNIIDNAPLSGSLKAFSAELSLLQVDQKVTSALFHLVRIFEEDIVWSPSEVAQIPMEELRKRRVIEIDPELRKRMDTRLELMRAAIDDLFTKLAGEFRDRSPRN